MTAPGTAARTRNFPAWLTFVDSVLPVTSVFVLHGSIRDLQLAPLGDSAPQLRALPAALRELLDRSGIPSLAYFSPLHGLSVLPGSDAEAMVRVLRERAQPTPPAAITDDGLVEVVAQIAGADDPCALVVDYVSQFPSESPTALQRALLRIANEVRPRGRAGAPRSLGTNPIFVMVDKPGDLPVWLLTGDGIRQVPIPEPDIEMRTRAALSLWPAIAGAPGADSLIHTDEDRTAIVKRFVDATHGLSLRALAEIVQLGRDAAIPADRVEDAARLYRVGLVADPWRSPEMRVRIAGGAEALERRVKGQPRAVRHAVDILVRSVTGMTSAHRRGASTGPRGVMFLAGPTGVGKTELAKSIAELLFGDESAYIRFDMSEFAEEAADQRLIGSPPGYVNHDAGGQLTNAVRDRPFSVLLFDEIEKAHPRVLDKFLQILSDGRLSDGSGDTVFFSESLIVFTSNLGVGEPGTSAEDCAADPIAYERAIVDAVGTVFARDLNRPELLGRIGDNIVAFNHLDDATAREIADGYIDNVLARVRRGGVTLTLPSDTRTAVVAAAVADLSLGARGVGNNLETAFVNPVARAVFDIRAGESRTISGISEDARGIVTVTLA
ncbi:AAA family ATPase [Microbacterium lacticum]